MNDEIDIEFYYVLYVQSVSRKKRLKNDVARMPGIMVIYIYYILEETPIFVRDPNYIDDVRKSYHQENIGK